MLLSVDILICTIDSGILEVPRVLMPPMESVQYIVSAQYTDSVWKNRIPGELSRRNDVKTVFLEGAGLSRNRNHAIGLSTADIMLISDDDCRYQPSFINTIVTAYLEHPSYDIIHFKAIAQSGLDLHTYPCDYVSSIEITIRNSFRFKNSKVRFNEDFGLGSPCLCSGEEDVFFKDAADAGLSIMYIGQPIVITRSETTGTKFLTNKKVQVSKGAAFCYVYGTTDAIWRSVKEGLWYFVHKQKNPFPIIYHMLGGILFIIKATKNRRASNNC